MPQDRNARFQATAEAACLLVGATLHCVVRAHVGQVFPKQPSWRECCVMQITIHSGPFCIHLHATF